LFSTRHFAVVYISLDIRRVTEAEQSRKRFEKERKREKKRKREKIVIKLHAEKRREEIHNLRKARHDV